MMTSLDHQQLIRRSRSGDEDFIAIENVEIELVDQDVQDEQVTATTTTKNIWGWDPDTGEFLQEVFLPTAD